ncbi:MAG: hypothetical protein V3W41_06720 [Planctomycetota bacterium]
MLKLESPQIVAILTLIAIMRAFEAGPLPSPVDDQVQQKAKTDLLALTAALHRQPATARRSWIESELDRLKIPFERHDFSEGGKRGRNLELSFGPETGALTVLSVHHDAAARQKNANGAISSCILAIQLAHHYQTQPPKAALKICFFDRGARSLSGSKAWIAANKARVIRSVLHADFCGVGDVFLLGRGSNSISAEFARCLGPAESRIMGFAPPGDHRAFWSAGVDAVSFSLCPSSEIEATAARFSGKRRRGPLLGVFSPSDKRKVEARALKLAMQGMRAILDSQLKSTAPGTPLRPRHLREIRDVMKLLLEGDRRVLVKELPKFGHPTLFFACLRLYGSKEEGDKGAATKALGRFFHGVVRRDFAAANTLAELGKVYKKHRRILCWDPRSSCFGLPIP